MDIVKELFGTEDLYEVLGTTKAKAKDDKALRSAYLKAALKYHPDKAPQEERELFTKKFQLIKKIHDLFQDKDLKKVYDDTGSWPEEDKFEVDLASFGRLDENAILEFKKLYQGSEEERNDIKKYYLEGKGDISHICDNVFFLNILDDEDKVNAVIEDLIEKGEVKRLTTGIKGAKAMEKKKKKAQKEAEEAEQIRKEKNLGSLEDLQKAIAKNSKSRDGFLDSLAAKYGGGGAKGSKRNGKKSATASNSEEEEDEPKPKKVKPTKSKSVPSRSTRSTRSNK